MRILHLSDLHIDVTHLRDQKIVLKALFADVAGDVATNGPFDLVLFTGDLIAKGAYSDENKSAALTEFVQPLLEASKASDNRFFVVPGNHDINLKKQSGILSSALNNLSGDENITKYLDEVTRTNNLATGLEDFNSFFSPVLKADPVLKNTHYSAFKLKVGSTIVGIAALNTAWRATGATADGDYGKLLVGNKQLDEVVLALDGCELKLAMMHHPVAWMAAKDARYVHRQFLVHFDALFHGHNHEADAQALSGTSNHYFISNAGCLYQSREYFNGYSIVDFDMAKEAWKICAREYIESRQVFDKSLRFAPDGTATFLRTPHAELSTGPTLPSDEYIQALQDAFSNHLLSYLVSDVAPPALRSIFVDPPISKVSTRQLSGEKMNGENAIFVPLKEIVLGKKNTIFIGSKDMGKTTLMHHICSLSLEYGQTDFPPFAAYVDLETTGDSRAAFLESIVSFGRGAYRRSEFLALLEAGTIAICFDNVRSHKTKQINTIVAFCSEFSRSRFYFSINEEIEYSLSPEELPRLCVDIDTFYLHPFGRKETRELTQRWYGETLSQASPKVDEVLSLLARLNIPRSPFLISALLWIRERQAQFAPVNQAEILDALIDGVMEKLSEKKDRSGLDSNIKRHFLASLAEHLHISKSRRITNHALDEFTVKYFGNKGLLTASGPFLEEMKKKGILLEIGNEVTFMFDSIRAFFLAARFQESPSLLEGALTREGFIACGEELDYFTGRHRDKRDVLVAASKIVEAFRVSAGLSDDLVQFDSISAKEDVLIVDEDGSGDAALKSVIAAHKPTDEKREELLEAIDEQTRLRSSNENEEIRLQRMRGSVGQYLEVLRIGSSILRNSELIDDLDLKKQVYSQFSHCWCEIMIAVLQSLEVASESHQGLDVLRGFLPKENSKLASYLFKMLAPNVVVALAVESLGTSKLQLFIEDKIENPKATVEGVINTFLAIDLGLPSRFDAITKLLEDFGKNGFVVELVFLKLMQMFYFSRLSKLDEDKVRKLLGDSISLMISRGSNTERSQTKTRVLASIEKMRLIKHH